MNFSPCLALWWDLFPKPHGNHLWRKAFIDFHAKYVASGCNEEMCAITVIIADFQIAIQPLHAQRGLLNLSSDIVELFPSCFGNGHSKKGYYMFSSADS